MTIKFANINVTTLGIGGCGCNTVRSLLKDDPIPFFRAIAMNLDGQQLGKLFDEDDDRVSIWNQNDALKVIQLLSDDKKGLGGGANPEVGEAAAIEKEGEIRQALRNTDVLLISAGLGKATGGGATPVVSQIAKDMGITTIALCTKPLNSERLVRRKKADEAAAKMRQIVPTAVIFNESLMKGEPNVVMTWDEAWKKVNDYTIVPMLNQIRSIAQTMGTISNSDLKDLMSVLSCGNDVWFNTIKFEERFDPARAPQLLENPFLNSKILRNGLGLYIWFSGPWTLNETVEMLQVVQSAVGTMDTDKEPELFQGISPGSSPCREVSLLAATDLDQFPDEEPKQQPARNGTSQSAPKTGQLPPSLRQIDAYIDRAVKSNEIFVTAALEQEVTLLRQRLASNNKPSAEEIAIVQTRVQEYYNRTHPNTTVRLLPPPPSQPEKKSWLGRFRR